MWNPSIRDLETIDDMANGRMAPARIASVLGIELQVFTAWNSRLAAARELDPDAVDRLCNPPKPVAVPPIMRIINPAIDRLAGRPRSRRKSFGLKLIPGRIRPPSTRGPLNQKRIVISPPPHVSNFSVRFIDLVLQDRNGYPNVQV